jgi:hypothetical protein
MECEERTRLAQEYFSAFEEHRRIAAEWRLLKDSGNPELAGIGETQTDAAIQVAYEAWRAFNEHQCDHQRRTSTDRALYVNLRTANFL